MNGRLIKINRIPVAITTIIITCILVYFINFHQDERPAVYSMLRNQNKINMRKLLIAAIQAAQLGGNEIVNIANTQQLKERSKGKTDEGANDPFTDADGRSHCVMKKGLQRIFPRVTIFSEEDKEQCVINTTFDLDPTVLHETATVPNELENIDDVTVWIDPLDATQEFTEKLYQYVTTMVCVAVRGKPVIGVIHRPFIHETAWAWVDHATSEYLASIHTQSPEPSVPIITVSRSHAGNVKNLTKDVFGKNANILTAAGAGYKVLQVVSNNATVYLHSTKIKKWDICAGEAILNAFGGIMTTIDDNFIDYGPTESPVNSKGLLATINVKDHNAYIAKLMNYQNNLKSSNHR